MQEPVDAALQQYADLSLLAEKRPASRRPTKLFVTARSQWETPHCKSCPQCREAARSEPDLDWMTPMTRACIDGRTPCVRQLLKAPDVDLDFADFDGHTALHAACAFGYEECARLLIQAGATLDMVDAEGATPLDGARMMGTGSGGAIASMLIEAGAKALPLDREGRQHGLLKTVKQKRERWATR